MRAIQIRRLPRSLPNGTDLHTRYPRRVVCANAKVAEEQQQFDEGRYDEETLVVEQQVRDKVLQQQIH